MPPGSSTFPRTSVRRRAPRSLRDTPRSHLALPDSSLQDGAPRVVDPSCEFPSSFPSRITNIRDGSPEVLDPPRFSTVSAPSVRWRPGSDRRPSPGPRTALAVSARPLRLERSTWCGSPFRAFLRTDRASVSRPSALLGFPVRRSNAVRVPFRALLPVRSARGRLGGDLVRLSGFPPRVFSSAAPIPGLQSPGPSSFALPAPRPVGLRCPAPWSLANGGIGWPFPAADPSGFCDLAVAS